MDRGLFPWWVVISQITAGKEMVQVQDSFQGGGGGTAALRTQVSGRECRKLWESLSCRVTLPGVVLIIWGEGSGSREAWLGHWA